MAQESAYEREGPHPRVIEATLQVWYKAERVVRIDRGTEVNCCGDTVGLNRTEVRERVIIAGKCPVCGTLYWKM